MPVPSPLTLHHTQDSLEGDGASPLMEEEEREGMSEAISGAHMEHLSNHKSLPSGNACTSLGAVVPLLLCCLSGGMSVMGFKL